MNRNQQKALQLTHVKVLLKKQAHQKVLLPNQRVHQVNLAINTLI